MADENQSGRTPMETTGESDSQGVMEQVPQAGEGTDEDEAVTTTGPSQGGSSGRTGEGPTDETDETPTDPTDEG